MSPSRPTPPWLDHLHALAREAPSRTELVGLVDRFLIEVDAERVFLFELRAGGGFRVLLARSADRELIPSPLKRLSHFAVRRMAQSEAPLLVADARKDRRWRSEDALEGKRGPVSILVLPLHADGRVSGGLYADHRHRSLRVPPEGPEALTAWASLVSAMLLVRRLAKRSVLGAGAGHASDRAQGTGRRGPREAAHDFGERTDGILADGILADGSLADGILADGILADGILADGGTAEGTAILEGHEVPSRGRGQGRSAEAVATLEAFGGFASANPDLRDLFEQLESLSASNLPILIRGETGVGKSLLARAIHDRSPRRDRPFVTLSMGSIPGELAESELLGHVRGAFTGALADREGAFPQADGGSLVMEEVADTTLEVQTKLLRVLEDGWVRPLGAKDSRQVDVRLLATSTRDLERLVRQGRFRKDLYYRLKGVVIEVPPLRERREDIVPLARRFLEERSREERRELPRLSPAAEEQLLRHSWPGNVRELESEMRRLVALGTGLIRKESLSVRSSVDRGRAGGAEAPPLEGSSLREILAHAEREALLGALRATSGNKSLAARRLGMTRKSLYRRLEKHGIKPEDSAPT